jgi:hypothetical protein
MSATGGLGRLYLVQQLRTLPREIVDKIFDDLTLFKVLQLATWADPVITAYILEHHQYRRAFLSPRHLAAAASRFAIWCQVKIACDWRNDRHLFPINPTSSLFAGVTYDAVMDDMISDIEDGNRRGSKYTQILSQFSPNPVSPGLDKTERRLRQHLQKFWSAQEAIKQLESLQLNVLADFLETYPYMLRWAYDPRGDESTTPPEHTVKTLRACAKKVFNTQYMRRRKPVHCMFAFRNGILPLVPRNWCLQLLLRSDLPADVLNLEASRRTSVKGMTDVLQCTSLAAPSEHIHGGSKNVQHLDNHPPEAAETTDPFPLHVTNDLRTVFRGLMHRYARPDHTIDGTPIARVSASDRIITIRDFFSRSSEERKHIVEQDPPSFLVPSRSEFWQRAEDMVHIDHHTWGYRRVEERQIMSILPYHQQEVAWLGAFLRSVMYLKTRDMPTEVLEE